MRSKTTKSFRKKLDALPNDVQKQADRSYLQFKLDPYHKSLRFKQVHKTLPIYSTRVSKSYRAVGQKDGDMIVWFWIGSHADYDTLLAQF